MEDKLTYDDVKDYEHLLTLAPPFLLKRMAKKNSNLVNKFKPRVQSFLNSLSDNQKRKLDILLVTDVYDLQELMGEAYSKSNKKQYKILADPKNREFIELNIEELKKIV